MEQLVINVNNFVYSVMNNFLQFIAICSPSCVNGNCTYPDVCNCSTGWEDSTCSTREYSFQYELRFLKTENMLSSFSSLAICSPTCMHSSNCTAPQTCVCSTGYNGSYCEYRKFFYS